MEIEPGGRRMARSRDRNPKQIEALHAELARIAKAQGVGPVTDGTKLQGPEKFDDPEFDRAIEALRAAGGQIRDPFSE